MMDIEPYKVWWRALRASDRSRWTRAVEEAFGPAAHLPFDQWWEACKAVLVDDTPLLTVKELASDAGWREYWDEWRDDSGDSIALWVNLTAPKDQLMRAFGDLLDQRHTGKRGRPQHRGTIADFSLAGPVNVQAANKALDVWETHRDEPALKLWEVGVRCAVNVNQIPRTGDPDAAQRRVLTITVSRYLRRAEALIRGVEVGTFPAR